MPLFDNKEHFMQAYQEEPSLLHEGAFGARWDCQNRKLLLEIPHGSKVPENSMFPGRAVRLANSLVRESRVCVCKIFCICKEGYHPL